MVSVLRPGQRIHHIPGIGVQTSRRAVSSGNGLLNNLVAYWPLSSVLDATGRGNTLTNSGASFVAAKIDNGADLERDEGDYLYIADNADLSMADIDFSIQAWVRLESKPASGGAGIVSKWGAGNNEYLLLYVQSIDAFRFAVMQGGATQINADSTAGSPALGTWYHVVARHDASANKISITINAGAADEKACTSGPSNTSGQIDIGRAALSSTYLLDGIIDEVGIWKRLLTPADISALYNAGAGLAYASFTV